MGYLSVGIGEILCLDIVALILVNDTKIAGSWTGQTIFGSGQCWHLNLASSNPLIDSAEEGGVITIGKLPKDRSTETIHTISLL